MTNKRSYIKHSIGDQITNGAVLIERINGRLWKIRCKCGNIFIGQPSNTSGRCSLCGYKQSGLSHTIHNESPHTNKSASRLYRIWLGMKARCMIPSASSYKDYGARGITICEAWNNYLTFKQWALTHGYADNLTLDRKDFNGNYTPENCKWATAKEQMRNTRKTHFITYKGETKSLAEWADLYNIKYHTLKQRVNKYGFSIEEALTLPVKSRLNLKKYRRQLNDI